MSLKTPLKTQRLFSKFYRHQPNYDLGRKFFYYMQIGSFKEYITINTATTQLRINRKQANGAWLFEEYHAVEDCFAIENIGLTINLKDIYSDVAL